MSRKTAIKVVEYDGYQGSNFLDAASHSALFRDDNPHQFGVMTSKLFASTEYLGTTDKKWHFLTYAKGNYVETIGTDEYDWIVKGDGNLDVVILGHLIPAGVTKVGRKTSTFEVIVDRPYIKPPEVWKTEDDSAPAVEILSEPVPYGLFGYKVTMKLQSGNVADYVLKDLFTKGKTLTRIGSRVAAEQNEDYGNPLFMNAPDTKLRGVVGRVANSISFTDRFLQKEWAAMQKGGRNDQGYKVNGTGKEYFDGSRGSIYWADATTSTGKTVNKGFFVTQAEQRVYEQCISDIEMMAEWGRLEINNDINSNRVKKTAAGWKQLYKDGQYFPHAGDLSLTQIQERLHTIMHRRRNFKNRKPVLVSGIGGIMYLSKLINEAVPDAVLAYQSQILSANDTPTGVHKNELQFGYQFTKINLAMGVEVQIFYDPTKDDPRLYKQKAPGSFLPLESFQIDILEFGETEDTLERKVGSNITMVVEKNADYYFSVYNAIDNAGKVVNDGRNVFTHRKENSIYCEKTGSIQVWDINAVGRFEWVPGLLG